MTCRREIGRGSGVPVHTKDDLLINVLEFLRMVISFFTLAIFEEAEPTNPGNPVLLMGDNQSAVHWINRCRGGKEPRSGALTQILGLVEIRGGWALVAIHVPGAVNREVDRISRWNRHII